MTVVADPDLLSIREAGVMLGVSEARAYAMARAGELPGAFKLGGRWRVSRIRLRREIHGDSSSAPAPSPAAAVEPARPGGERPNRRRGNPPQLQGAGTR